MFKDVLHRHFCIAFNVNGGQRPALTIPPIDTSTSILKTCMQRDSLGTLFSGCMGISVQYIFKWTTISRKHLGFFSVLCAQETAL